MAQGDVEERASITHFGDAQRQLFLQRLHGGGLRSRHVARCSEPPRRADVASRQGMEAELDPSDAAAAPPPLTANGDDHGAGAFFGGPRRQKQHERSQRRRVVWDETNLEYNEAHRSSKQKINEPKTPFHQLSLDSEDGSALSPYYPPADSSDCEQMPGPADAAAIRDALKQVAESGSASAGEAGPSLGRKRSGGWTSSEDDSSDVDHDDRSGSEDGKKATSIMSRKGKEQVHFDTDSSAYENDMDDKDVSSDFKEHRRKHYDEFRQWKLLKKVNPAALAEPELLSGSREPAADDSTAEEMSEHGAELALDERYVRNLGEGLALTSDLQRGREEVDTSTQSIDLTDGA